MSIKDSAVILQEAQSQCLRRKHYLPEVFFFFLFDGLFLVGCLLLVSWDFFFFFLSREGGDFFLFVFLLV